MAKEDFSFPIAFDGHNDVLSRLYRAGGVKAAPTFLSGREGHIDLPKSKTGGFGGGFFAIYVPSEHLLQASLGFVRESA